LAVSTRLRLFYLFHLAKPASDRQVFQAAHQSKSRKFLEIGVGDGERALRLIELAAQHFPADQISYTGVDLFEARPKTAAAGLSLRAAHKMLSATGARIRLLHGDPLTAISRAVTERIESYDFVVVSADVEKASADRVWLYFPRILHKRSRVLLEEPKGAETEIRVLTAREVLSRAEKARTRRHAA
jgi:hypothetical protein